MLSIYYSTFECTFVIIRLVHCMWGKKIIGTQCNQTDLSASFPHSKFAHFCPTFERITIKLCPTSPLALFTQSLSLSLSLSIPGCTNRWGVINRPPRRLCLIGLPRPSAMCLREMLTLLTVRLLTSPLSHFELLSRERSIYYEDSFGYEQIPDGFVGMKITKIKGKMTVVARPLIRCTKMLHSKSE